MRQKKAPFQNGARSGLAGLFLILWWPTFTLSEPALPYLPLTDGNSWQYVQNESPRSVIISGTELVNAVPTKVMTHSTGARQYWTNDVLGIRLHRRFLNVNSVTQTYSPAIVIAGSDLTPGSAVGTAGGVIVESPLCGFAIALSYFALLRSLALNL